MLVDEGLEILDEKECRRLLSACHLGRVGVTVEALPAIFPVNYRVIEDGVFFCTSPGTKLSIATDKRIVAFQVDGGTDPMYHQGWSVMVVGRTEEVDDATQLESIQHRLPAPWAPCPRWRVVRIGIDLISGRRIQHAW